MDDPLHPIDSYIIKLTVCLAHITTSQKSSNLFPPPPPPRVTTVPCQEKVHRRCNLDIARLPFALDLLDRVADPGGDEVATVTEIVPRGPVA